METAHTDALDRCPRCGCTALRGACAHCTPEAAFLCPVRSPARSAWATRLSAAEARALDAERRARMATGLVAPLSHMVASGVMVWSALAGHAAPAWMFVAWLVVVFASIACGVLLSRRARDLEGRAGRMRRRGWASEASERAAPMRTT